MFKKILLRIAIGFPIGVAIGYWITIILSLCFASGYYSPCAPALIAAMGSKISAVFFQALLCGLLGSGFAGISIIWELDHWNLAAQTGVYFLAASLLMLPIAYFTFWMEHSVRGFLLYFGIFTLIFLVIWLFQFFLGKALVRKMNARLPQAKDPPSQQ